MYTSQYIAPWILTSVYAHIPITQIKLSNILTIFSRRGPPDRTTWFRETMLSFLLSADRSKGRECWNQSFFPLQIAGEILAIPAVQPSFSWASQELSFLFVFSQPHLSLVSHSLNLKYFRKQLISYDCLFIHLFIYIFNLSMQNSKGSSLILPPAMQVLFLENHWLLDMPSSTPHPPTWETWGSTCTLS